MGVFDFTNYTYSAMISFIAMVIGMSYPLLTQAIHRITDIYNDDFMTMRFTREPAYCRFNKILVVAVVIGFILPFILFLFDCLHFFIVSYILIGIQVFVTFFLIWKSIQLYKLIVTYYNSNDLLEHVTKSGEDSLHQCLSIMLRSAKSGNKDTYRQSLQCIYDQIVKYQNDFYKNAENKDKPIEYPQNYYDVLDKIIEATIQKDRYYFFSKENPYSELFYNYSFNVIVSSTTLKYFWIYINRVVETNCFEWFQQYWMSADQYYRFTLDKYSDAIQNTPTTIKNLKRQFLFMHFMVGGLMVYKKNYAWLKYMLTFSQTLPYSHPLIPSSFGDIWEMLKTVYNKKRSPLALESEYMFIGLTADVSADDMICKYAERYSALLLMRLFSGSAAKEDDCVSPKVEDGIYANEQIIGVCESLKRDIMELSDDDKLKDYLNYSGDNAIEFIDIFIQEAYNKINQIQKEKKTDINKLVNLKNEIIETCKILGDLLLPESEEGELKLIKNKTQLTEDLVCYGYDIHCAGFAESIVAPIYYLIYNWYEAHFMRLPATKKYQIRYKEIFKALDALKLDKNYAIIFLGIYTGNFTAIYGSIPDLCEKNGHAISYKGVPIYTISNSVKQSVIIMKVEEMPKVCFCNIRIPSEEDQGLIPIDKKHMGIYTNIDFSNPPEELTNNAREFLFGRVVRFSPENPMFRYVRLNITYDPTIGKGNLNDISPIQKLLG